MAQLTDTEIRTALNNMARKDKLTRDKADIVSQVTRWVSEATQLHTDSHPADKADIVQLRNDLIADLRTPLGV